MASNTVCKENMCVGCMACLDVCPKGAIQIVDTIQEYNAVINQDKCIHCDLCHKSCQNNRTINKQSPILWMQGWIRDEKLRIKSSSGGAARALSEAFIARGGIVYSCLFRNGDFTFESANSLEEIAQFTGSKYVKSNPTGVYKRIKKDITEGNRVLFIGLPCQVSAVKELVGEGGSGSLYTVDLICHGTPSPKLLENYFNHRKINKIKLNDIQEIAFRYKESNKDSNHLKSMVTPGAVDKYSLGFLCGLDYTECCYSCKYAGKERVSDITIGDSWNSDLDNEEQKKGISLILCQTDKGVRLLQSADMNLFPVDLERTIAANAQLRGPSQKGVRHDKFYKTFRKTGNINKAVFRSLPKKCMMQKIKGILLKIKICRYGGASPYLLSVKAGEKIK